MIDKCGNSKNVGCSGLKWMFLSEFRRVSYKILFVFIILIVLLKRLGVVEVSFITFLGWRLTYPLIALAT